MSEDVQDSQETATAGAEKVRLVKATSGRLEDELAPPILTTSRMKCPEGVETVGREVVRIPEPVSLAGFDVPSDVTELDETRSSDSAAGKIPRVRRSRDVR